MALQSHPRSLILAPIESTYVTSYWSWIVSLVLSCPISEILQVSWEERPDPYSTRIFGVFPMDYRLRMLWLRGAKTLNIRVITFELIQRPQYHVTDGRTTYDSNTALALCASRGNESAVWLSKESIGLIAIETTSSIPSLDFKIVNRHTHTNRPTVVP